MTGTLTGVIGDLGTFIDVHDGLGCDSHIVAEGLDYEGDSSIEGRPRLWKAQESFRSCVLLGAWRIENKSWGGKEAQGWTISLTMNIHGFLGASSTLLDCPFWKYLSLYVFATFQMAHPTRYPAKDL